MAEDPRSSDLCETRAFVQQVFDFVRTIPPGRVMAYSDVAAALGRPKNARQVGQALGSLPPGTSVPWHRVLRSSGHIAHGGEPDLQRTRLILEGIELVSDRVSMDRYRWNPGDNA